MKTFLAAALIASTAFAAPTLLIITPAAATICSEKAPEGHKRPGGFCELRDNTATLAPPVTSAAPVAEAPQVAPGNGCTSIDVRKLLRHTSRGARILAAC